MKGHLPEAALFEAALEYDAPSAMRHNAEVAAHLSSCTRCQGRLAELREDLATMLCQGEAAEPAPELRTHILSGIQDGADSFSGLVRRFIRMFDTDAAQAQAVLSAAQDDSAWEICGAVSYFHFAPGATLKSVAEAGIVRLVPGACFPAHRHRGDEHGLVLRGILREDHSGKEAFPGDFVFMPQGSIHTVTCTSQESCVFAVLLYGGNPSFAIS